VAWLERGVTAEQLKVKSDMPTAVHFPQIKEQR
jgi:hypothetical protein